MSLSQFFILSVRGDTIIMVDFRADLPKVNEIFFRQVKFYQGKQQEAPPVFYIDGINFIYVKKNGLYFVAIARNNISPAYVLELIERFTKIFKDYCGILSEEAMRKNFVLIYELINEMVDFGYPLNTSSESLKSFVFNEPIQVESSNILDSLKFEFKNSLTLNRIPEVYQRTTPSSAVEKPITGNEKRKNEIFVDIFERISLTFSKEGSIFNSEIDGQIVMKSYLSGNPSLKLAINEDFNNECSFHNLVNLDDWDNKILNIVPQDGEFTVMNYRVDSDIRAPFIIIPFFELTTDYRVELLLKIRADIPTDNYGNNVQVSIPVPRDTQNIATELGVGVVGQSVENLAGEKKIIWRIKKFNGQTEQTLHVKITLNQSHTAAIRKEIGPISMSFEIPMYNISNLQVKYLRILETSHSYNPYRWVRYVTKSNSYICRL